MKLKHIIAENNSNFEIKFESDAFDFLKSHGGWRPTSYWMTGNRHIPRIYNSSQNVDTSAAEQADVIQFTSYDDGAMESVSIKLPKKYPISGIRMFELINKKRDTNSAFVNLSTHMSKLIRGLNMYAYPTSYGIGVSNMYNPMKQKDIDTISKILTDLQLEYKIELSDGFWVTRFIVSKKSSNINILNKL